MRLMVGNLKFKFKILLIWIGMMLISSFITGKLYYDRVFEDTIQNYYSSAEDMVSQMQFFLTNEIQSVTQRMHAMYANKRFYETIAAHMRKPTGVSYALSLGTISDIILEIQQGDRYIHSVYIYTKDGVFTDFTRILNHDFAFEESELYGYFADNPYETIAWFPVMESPMFAGTDRIIPVVYRFKVERHDVYAVVSLQQSEMEKYLSETYNSYDRIFIVDRDGNDILNCGEEEQKILSLFEGEEGIQKFPLCKEVTYMGETYLATCTQMHGTEWKICALRSAQSLIGNLRSLRMFVVAVLCVCVLISIVVMVAVSNAITRPLNSLAMSMQQVTDENLDAQYRYPYTDEVGQLASSYNFMIGRIKALITDLNVHIEALKEEKENVRLLEGQKRRAELRALQAQINPHFLYNTLNTITWQASDQGASEISVLSNSLGKFFRIALSRGEEFIFIREELEHVSSYLKIQEIRYKDKLRFEMDAPEDVKELYTIKLILQPLVENAIYHGIKEMEGQGLIRISLKRRQNEQNVHTLQICVWDNGEGIPSEKLEVLNRGLAFGKINRGSGYGIYNVNERIKLCYGEAYGLTLESSYKEWTRSIVVLPIQTEIERQTDTEEQ